MYTCVYIYIYIYTHTLYTCMHTYIYICIYNCMCISIYIYIYVYTRVAAVEEVHQNVGREARHDHEAAYPVWLVQCLCLFDGIFV